MKRYIIRNILIARLSVLALSALCFLQAPVRAEETTCNVIFPPVGLAPIQSLSLTFFNPNGTPVHAKAQIHNAGGMQVGLGDGSVRFLQYSVQAGAFYSFKINYSDIHLSGDERTGRKQILASVSLTFSEANNPVVASMEIIDVRDGTSNTILVGEVTPSMIPPIWILTRNTPSSSGGGNDFLNSGFGNDIIMGIPTGHMLLVTLFNPPPSGSEAQREPVSGHVKIFDGSGNLIAQSPEQVVQPGEFGSFKFNQNEISLLGEPGANRAPVRIKPFFKFESKRLSTQPSPDIVMTNLISFEVVDLSTGKTVTLSGQQCLVFYLGGTPGI
jgi:hypothetical protein